AMPARLLLVPAADLHALADGLLVGHLPALGFRIDAVLALQALERNPQVHLALAPQHHLVGVLGVLEAQRGIFFHQPRQRTRQLHLVLAVFDADGNAVDGLWRLGRLDLHAAAFVGRDGLARYDLFQPAERDGVAGPARGALARLLTQ